MWKLILMFTTISYSQLFIRFCHTPRAAPLLAVLEFRIPMKYFRWRFLFLRRSQKSMTFAQHTLLGLGVEQTYRWQQQQQQQQDPRKLPRRCAPWAMRLRLRAAATHTHTLAQHTHTLAGTHIKQALLIFADMPGQRGKPSGKC